jgi:hypothetical protein
LTFARKEAGKYFNKSVMVKVSSLPSDFHTFDLIEELMGGQKFEHNKYFQQHVDGCYN